MKTFRDARERASDTEAIEANLVEKFMGASRDGVDDPD
jgi:hypothetical protein